MKTEPIYLKPDSRNRISLGKVTKGLPQLYRAYELNGNIILEPIKDINKEVEWIFKPENKHLLEIVKKGLSQEANIDLGSFAQYADDED